MRSRRSERAGRFDLLIRPHVVPMYQSAYRLLRNEHDAEDLVQDVLTKLYPQTDRLEQIEALRPWLLRVVYHAYVDVLRHRERLPRTVADETLMGSLPDETSGPEALSWNKQIALRLNHALAQLPEDQRALVDLHLIQGYTLQELAGAFDTPIGTLKAQVHRIKGRLKKQLADATF